MPIFWATMRVVHMETWTVEAENEIDARLKLIHADKDVDTYDIGGEVVDWEVSSIKQKDE